MLKEIKHNLYKINYYSSAVYVESETKTELFNFLAHQEVKGYAIFSVNIIELNGKTPKLAFRTDKEYKSIRNKLLMEKTK